MTNTKSRLVPWMARGFGWLRKITLLSIINGSIKRTKHNHRFTDFYVIIFSFASIILFSIEPLIRQLYIEIIIRFIAFWRIYGIIVFLSNTLLFDVYRDAMNNRPPSPLAGHRRILILIFFNYIELTFLFAFLFRSFIPPLSLNLISNWWEIVNISFINLSGFGSSKITLHGTQLILALFESVVGLFMAVLAISRFISLLQKRESNDEFEKRLNDKSST